MQKIVVMDYDPAWPTVFEELRAKVWTVVKAFAVGIEHIGSTSVPGLAAKPIVDIAVVVPSSQFIQCAIEGLATLGYTHRGDLGVKGREAFQSPADWPRHHLYVCPVGSLALLNPIALRDYLRVNPSAARAYGNLKKELASRFPDDIESYLDGKTDTILNILREKGFSQEQLITIERINRKPHA